MIIHTKFRYFDEIHKICDSHTIFLFFSLIFLSVVLKGKTKVLQTANLFILFVFRQLLPKLKLSRFSEIYVVHEKRKEKCS